MCIQYGSHSSAQKVNVMMASNEPKSIYWGSDVTRQQGTQGNWKSQASNPRPYCSQANNKTEALNPQKCEHQSLYFTTNWIT